MHRNAREYVLIFTLLLVATLIRLWGINYDLPYIYHPDEPYTVEISQQIFKTGDFNPHSFNYPSLSIYIQTLAYVPYFLLGKLTGILQTPGDLQSLKTLGMGITLAQMPTTVLMGRMVTIALGVAAVGLTYITGKVISGKISVGLLAGLALAISPTSVAQSRYITPDIPLTLFTLAAILGSILIIQQGKMRHYVLAGLCVGFAASCKYNGGLVMISVVGAHILRCGMTSLKDPKIYIAGFLSGIGFVLTTPFAILDFNTFLADMTMATSRYNYGLEGMEGNSLGWYLNYMWTTGGLIYLFALAGVFYGFLQRDRSLIGLSFFPLLYFPFISSLLLRNERTFLPLTPVLFLFAASLLIAIGDSLKNLKHGVKRQTLLFFWGLFILVSIALPLLLTIQNSYRLATYDSRETARKWLTENIPAGETIALEAYSPYLDPERYLILYLGQMIYQEPDWYRQHGVDYLVFSKGMFGRFYAEPEKYGEAIQKYERLFDEFHFVKSFLEGDDEIRVYQVR
jgi:4-amino-4-deoxy-L-arabinose transferase-like glycosyltransferase